MQIEDDDVGAWHDGNRALHQRGDGPRLARSRLAKDSEVPPEEIGRIEAYSERRVRRHGAD